MTLGSSVLLADSWGMHGDVGTGWMIAMMFFMVLFWAVVILGIVWLVRGSNDGWRGGRRESPSEILDRRFAEGAISVEDYNERRGIVGNSDRKTTSTRGTPPGTATG
jgi:putative membrane protein